MSHEILISTLVRWLLAHGFYQLPDRAGGHRYYTDGRVKITVRLHGPRELPKPHLASALRELERRGYPRAEVLAELRAGRWAQRTG